MLEKIKEYLKSYSLMRMYVADYDKVANDITEIVEKEIATLKSKISKLEKNEEIYHERLKDIKYLDRDTLIKTIKEYINLPEEDWLEELFDNLDGWGGLINAILSLAINRDKGVEVLKKYKSEIAFELFRQQGKSQVYWEDFINGFIEIADEIIGKDK